MIDDQKTPIAEVADELERAVGDVFAVHDVTLGIPEQLDTIRLRGHLQVASDKAYAKIADRFRKMGYTAFLRHDEDHDLDVILAMPGITPEKSNSRLWINLLLYVATIITTLFVGVSWSDQVPTDADLVWLVTHLWLGWPFALSLMTILTGHELGHYFAARYYKVPVSLPYFIPVPVPPLGTMGAFIRMEGRSVDRRQMLTVGAAGPLVGFVLAVPILLLGLSLSTITPMGSPEPGTALMMEGNSILYLFFKLAVFGQILPGSGAPVTMLAGLQEAGQALLGFYPLGHGFDVSVHPVAFAGWAGLLVTALNLIPAGQLDGGHVLYSLFGQRARVLTWPIIAVLVLLGIFFWQGWLLWAGLIFFFGQSHPDPLDDVTRLDGPRKAIAVAVLAIFVLTFTPVPIEVFYSELPAQESGQFLNCLAVLGMAAVGVIGVLRWARSKRQAEGSRGGSDG